MNRIFVFLGIFFVLAASRFIPHPPNFTSVLALAFYVPAILGLRYIPVLAISFIITDFIIGYHNLTHWTWGSIILIGLISTFFKRNFSLRIIGTTCGAILFYLITNFGVWTTGSYGYNLNGLITSYTLAIPFFYYTLLSTFIFSLTIEIILKFYKSIFNNFEVTK